MKTLRALFASAACAVTLAAQEAAPVGSGASAGGTVDTLLEALAFRIGDNTAGQILAAFAVLLVALALRGVITGVAFSWLKRLSSRTEGTLDDALIEAVRRPVEWLTLVIGVFVAVRVLALPADVDGLVVKVFQAGTVVVFLWAALRVVDVVADAIAGRSRERNVQLAMLIPLLKKAARIFVVILGVILAADNLGYSVSGLIAGLGIGGLAVALAAQESLSNLFGSVTIAADLPFQVGHWIKAGEIEGTVEEVGLRSTKIRTFSGSLLQVPNKILAAEAIENFSRMRNRRVAQVIGVSYETSPETMELLVADFRAILLADEGVDKGATLEVQFDDFGDSSLNIAVLYYTTDVSLRGYRDNRQRINLALMRAVAARGTSIAFPTRTLYLEGPVARALAERGGAS